MKYIREQLGLTQDELANYLQISRSWLSHYEGDRRNIPVQSMQKVARLAQLIDKPAPENLTENSRNSLQKIAADEQKQRQRYARDYNIKATIVERELEKIQKQYQAAYTLLCTADTLLAETANTTVDELELKCIELMAKKALLQLAEYNQAKQTLLKEKLKAYKAIAEALSS